MTSDTPEAVESLADLLADYLANYTLPANYRSPYGIENHRDVAKRCAPLLVEEVIEPWLARDRAQQRAEALYELRDALYRGEGPDLWADGDIVYGEWIGNYADARASRTDGGQ